MVWCRARKRVIREGRHNEKWILLLKNIKILSI